jgi:FlaA1/EpsC-like NDP-sugar epimerase
MRNRIFLAIDVLVALFAIVAAFSARFEGLSWWSNLGGMAIAYAAIAIPLKLIAFVSVGLYSRLWRYASIADLEVALVASLAGTAVSFAVGVFVVPAAHLADSRVPFGILLMDAVLTSAGITLSRLLLRVITRHSRARRGKGARGWTRGSRLREGKRVLIAGAGDAGGMIAKELLNNQQLGLVPVGFVDDDYTKHGHHLHGLRVFGPVSQLEDVVRRLGIEEVITALPTARGKIIRDIMQRSSAAGVRNRTVPGLYEILSGAKSVSSLRSIQIEDLLRRDPIQTDLEMVSTLVTDRKVLITGAGGSIGSELCRQLAMLSPTELIAVGRGENSIFELLQELAARFPHIPVKPAIADVRDRVRMHAIFESARPYTVFHAAAHKHVPLMESSIDEAILNNVLGTRNVAELCGEFDVEHLVLISTDKAVRPTSIMGASKRIAEGTVCSVAERTGRPYVSVRFGNVLGSRGSVVPTFLRQIEAGGPVTITHAEMRRYFMTIPEAVQLVLQAAAQGTGGEVFVLDMGEPVRIADLAEDLIRLSGLEVEHDIEIHYTGMRPGEKLYEELFFGPNDASPTAHPKVLQAKDSNHSPEFDLNVDKLVEAARRRESEAELRRMIRVLVPEYCSSMTPSDSTMAIPAERLALAAERTSPV